jgi:thiamine-phosphate pyrophosphorylase
MQQLDWPLLLYYITDRKQLAGTDALLARISAAAQAGVDWIQLREKDLSTRELDRLARQSRKAVAGTSTKLLINSRVDIAVACGLDGVHLTSGQDELPPSEARVAFAKAGMTSPLIGVSCHSMKEVLLAESHGADFIVFGPVFGKGERTGTGLEVLRATCSSLPKGSTMKVLALGGVEVANAADCVRAGAAGVAGIRLFQDDAVRSVVDLLRHS